MYGHACSRNGRLFGDDPECEGDTAAANLDRRVLRSGRRCRRLIDGGWRCGLRWLQRRLFGPEVRIGCAGRGAANRCKTHLGLADLESALYPAPYARAMVAVHVPGLPSEAATP